MLSKFQQGIISDHRAMEDINNNDIYVLDPFTNEVRKARDCDEWLTCKIVYVYSVPYREFDGVIRKGEHCRCWMVHLII